MEGYRPNSEKKESNLLGSEIAQKRETLEKDRAIEIDMHISPEERVRIEQDLEQFDFYGANSVELKTNVKAYLSAMGENDPEDLSHIADIVCRLSEGMREGFGEESTWTMMRVRLPNDFYEIPRWHNDGKYFESTKKQYKLVATLKGAHTRFGETVNPDTVEKLQKARSENLRINRNNEEQLSAQDMRIRKELDEIIVEKNIVKGKAVVYLVGESDAVLHSEPDITEPRIFVSVLPGSGEQISEWQGR